MAPAWVRSPSVNSTTPSAPTQPNAEPAAAHVIADEPTRDEDLLAGTEYVFCERIGRGTMGDVIVAEHPNYGRVVIKLLREELAARSDLVQRMCVEARVLALLAHPNIVGLIELSATPAGRPMLVMEHLVGRTLKEEMSERGRFPIDEAVAVTRQILAGLAAAHAAGILHRDVKPANMILAATSGGEKVVKVLDFGVAKVLEDSAIREGSGEKLPMLTMPGALLGTPRFLSPEQILRKPLDARADLYAVGLVLYALLVGEGPFDALHDFPSVLWAHLETIPEPPGKRVPKIPRALDKVVMRALAKRREDRFESAEAFIAALDALVASSASASPISSVGVASRPADPPILPSAPTPRSDAPRPSRDPASRSRAERHAYVVFAAGLLLFAASIAVFLLTRR
jgi:eukaryotic-like serine/threonine-protein kinase